LSSLFKGELLNFIHQLFLENKLYIHTKTKTNYCKTKNKLYSKNWNVYAKKAFGGPQQLLEYIGRYTHKICISNFRIEHIDLKNVTFRYLDRKAKQSKSMMLIGVQFLKYFAEHILSKGFVRIRHIGFLSSRAKKKNLSIIRKILRVAATASKPKLTTREFSKLTTGKIPIFVRAVKKAKWLS